MKKIISNNIYIILFFFLFAFNSCEKDDNIIYEKDDLEQISVQYDKYYTRINRKDSTIIIFNSVGSNLIKKSTSSINLFLQNNVPEYVFQPENHVDDGQAISACNTGYHLDPDLTLGYNIDLHPTNGIGISVYSYGNLIREDFSKENVYFYNTNSQKPVKKYLDCWCENDPTETVKQLF